MTFKLLEAAKAWRAQQAKQQAQNETAAIDHDAKAQGSDEEDEEFEENVAKNYKPRGGSGQDSDTDLSSSESDDEMSENGGAE